MKSLIHTAVVTLFAASAAHAQQVVQWRVEDGGNGHWYQFVVVAPSSSWTSANSEAAARNGYLASVHSSTEATFVQLLANATAGAFTSNPGGNEVGPWLGATRILGTNGWQWTSGEPWAFTQWCSGEPNGGSSEPHVHLMRNGATSCWNDRENNAFGVGNPSFVIEWSADCNNDGTVDYGQILQGQLADTNTNGVPDICEVPTCHDIDLNLNEIVEGGDLGVLLAFWGPVSPAFPRADIYSDGLVNGADLGILLAFWGPCPN
jgi:hypothetical protein